MKAEIPFLMKTSINWINKRKIEKRKDKIFIENFDKFDKEQKDLLKMATEQVIDQFKSRGTTQEEKKKAEFCFYPVESF